MKRSQPPQSISEKVMHTLRFRLRVPVTVLMLGCNLAWTLQSNGEVLIKTNSGATGTFLAPQGVLPSVGYTNSAAPTASDTLLFRSDIYGASNFRVSNVANANLSVLGLKLVNPGGALIIQNNDSQNQTITLGAGGIDMSLATQNLTISNTSTTNGITLALTNAGAATWSVAQGRLLQVATNITGSNGLTINPGANGLGGAVTLGGTNSPGTSFTGATTVNDSTLNLEFTTAANRIHSGSALNLNRGVLNMQGGSTQAQAVAGLNLGAGSNQITRSAGGGTLNVGTITRTSPTALLNVGTASVVTTTNANVNGILGGWAVLNNSDWAVGGGAITGLSSYTDKTGAWGTVPATTANVRLTGSVTAVPAGTINSLKINGNFSLTQNAGTILNIASGGILKNDNTTATISGGSLTAGGTADGAVDTLYLWTSQNTMTVSSNIVNNGTDVVNLVKAGSSTTASDLVLSGSASTYTGTTTIANGRLSIANINAINKAGDIAIYGNSGTDNTGSLQWNTGSATLTGNITGAAGNDALRHALRKQTTSVLTLTPTTANTYSGSTWIEGGTLRAGNVNAFSPNSRYQLGTVADAVLDLNGNNNTIRGLTGGGAAGGNVTLGSGNLTLQTLATDAFSYGGVISGTGSLIKSGDGLQTLTASQTFTGALSVNAGVLDTLALSAGNINVAAGATLITSSLLNPNAAITISGDGFVQMKPGANMPANLPLNLTGDGSTIQFANGSVQSLTDAFSGVYGSRLLMGAGASDSGLTFSDASGTNVIESVLAMSSNQSVGLGNVIFDGGATWELVRGNTYTGSTTLNAGILRVSTNATTEVLPDTTALSLASGTGFNLNGRSETIGSLSGAGNVALDAGTLTLGGNNLSSEFSGVLSGTGGLIKNGTGNLTLSGANTLTGGLRMNGGTVTLAKAGGNTLPASSSVNLQGIDSRLVVNTSQVLGALTVAPGTTVEVPTGAELTTTQDTAPALTVNAHGDADTRIIRLQNANDAAKIRPGMPITGGGLDGAYVTQVLTDGQILINMGLQSNFTNAPLTFGAITEVAGTMTGNGTWTKTGTGRAVVSGNQALSGTINLAAGSLQVGGVNNNGRNWLNGILDDQVSLIMGTGTTLDFTKNLATFTTFERIGSLEGGSATTTINLLGSVTTSTAGTNTGTILAVGGNNATGKTFTGNITGSTNSGFVKEGSGTLTWVSNNADSMTGTIRVDGGTLTIEGSEGVNSAVRLVVSNQPGAKVVLNATTSETVNSLTGGGRGAVTSFANGTLGALPGAYLNGGGGEVNIARISNFTFDNSTQNTTFRYGGSITGEGSFVKNGPNTLELYGDSIYKGSTTIQASAVADSRTSTLRLGAYGTSAGVGSLPSGGHGSLPESTVLSLFAGNAGSSRNAAFDLNGANQTVSTLTSAFEVGTRIVQMRNGTLNIKIAETGTSGTYTGTFEGMGTINVKATRGTNGWMLTGDSNATQSGAVNVLGGTLSLGRAGGTLGDKVHVQVTTGGVLSVLESDIIGSLSGNGVVTVSPGRVLTISAAPAGGVANNAWSGTIDGGGSIALAAGGSLRLTTPQNFDGILEARSGSSLYLDFGTSATAPQLLKGALRLSGGNLFINGTAAQTITTTTIADGSSLIFTKVGDSARLNLTNIVRQPGGVLQVRGGSVTTNTAAVHGILGGYATYHAVDVDGNPVVSWAVPGGAGSPVIGLTSYASSFGSGLNTDVTIANTQEPVGGAVGSLRFNSPAAVDLFVGGASGTQQTVIQSGGILVTPAVGPNNVFIRALEAGASLTGGASTSDYRVVDELIVHQHNTRGSLTIDANITDRGGATRLTKTGQGTLVLTRGNTYTGQTSIFGGVLELASENGEHGDLGLGALPLQNYGYLVFNRNEISTNPYEVNSDVTGTGIIRKDNIGTVVLRGGNSNYTGPTQVLRGKLAVANSMTGLGSPDGLTSVASAGTLEVRGANLLESVVLQGGILSAAVGPGGITGTVTLMESSTLRSEGSVAGLTISGPILAVPGRTLTVNGGVNGRVTLTNASNQLGDITVAPNVFLQIGNISAGSVGRGNILNNGTIVTNLNDTNFVLGAKISGTGGFVQVRNTVFLTADNTYSGGTIVGGNGAIGQANNGAQLRVGNDTYTGSLGSGDITVQAATTDQSLLRYHLLRSQVLANNIILNPNTDTANSARNATLFRNSLGTLTLAGTITAGTHDTSSNAGQRAILNSEGGGKLVIRGTINNGETSTLSIVNNGLVVFDGSNEQNLYGPLSGGNIYVFRNDNTITLRGVNTFNVTNYVQRGTLAINNSAGTGIHDDADLYVARGATLRFETSDLIGAFYGMKGANLELTNGSTLTLDDALTTGSYATIRGNGSLALNANGGTAFYGLFGPNELSSAPTIGSVNQLVTVRVDSLKNEGEISSLGRANNIILGLANGSGESRLEYIGNGDSTNKKISINNGSGAAVRIAGSGRGALILNGDIAVTSAGNKTLYLHGQTAGNTVNGRILEDNALQSLNTTLSLNVNSAAGNNDMYGLGRWVLTNSGSDFSGSITVNLGVLELAGDLGSGSSATSLLGNLSVTRTVDLGTANFDGRRFDVYSGGDNLGALAGAANNGAILFNDPNAGTTVFDKLNFTQSFTGTGNIGSGELINNGTKVLEFKGTFTTTSSEAAARSWTLDGTNTGTNLISGVISDTPSGSSTTSVLKEGTGTWRLTGVNTYQGATTVARGILEISGGTTIFDDGILNVSNAGSDFSSVGGAVLKILTSETVGGIQGGIGGVIDIAANQILTTRNANQTFNGIVSGDGGITRTNNDGNARVTTMTAKSTYNGVTTITTNGTNLVGNRIDVSFLADGGQASGFGKSSNAAANLILNTGTGGGGIRWIGIGRDTGGHSTDRLFTLGSGTNGIWADGTVVGDFAPAMTFSNTGAIAFLAPNTTQTLVLRGSTISDNTFSPLLGNNGTGATTLSKVDGGMWVVTNANTYTGGTSVTGGTLATSNNSGFGTGTVTVNGGGGIGVQLRGGVTIANALANNTGDGGLAAYSGNNTWAGNITLTPGNWRLGTDTDASLNLSGTVSGLGTSVRLIKYGQGTLTLSGTMTHTGITNIAGGTVVLNYDTAAGGSVSSKLADGSVLELGWTAGTSGITTGLGAESDVGGQSAQYAFSGGTLILSGGAAGAHNEIVSATTLNAGASRVIRQGSAVTTLQMGTITRAAGNNTVEYGTIDFGAGGIATTNTLNTSGGILANTGTNTLNSAYATVDRTNWATTNTSGTNISIQPLATYNTNGFGANQNTNITNATTNLSAATTTHTLRFDTNTGGTTLNLGTSTLSLETGGILVTKNNTDNITFTGGILTRSTNGTGLDTVIHHHGTGTLTINSVIANNANAQAFTKTGTGLVVLTGANTFTGRVTLQQGVTQVGDGTAGSTTARLGNGNNTIGMSEGTTLRINVANSALEYTPNVITGGGLLHLASTNQSIFTLNQDNANWIGDVLIEGGTLRLRHNGGLGNVRGITTIGAGGTLELSLNNLNTTERITMLNGSRITTVANGATNTTATISAPMTMQNTTSAGATFDIATSQFLTLSSLIRATNGFTKTGNGTLTISGNHMQDLLEGAILGTTTPNTNSALRGQIVVNNGDLRVGGTRALGATGAGNETIVTGNGSLDLRGQSLNYGDDPDPFREIIRVEGSGFNGTGALKNTSGLGVFSHLEIVAGTTTTLSSGGSANGARLVLAPYDVNPNTGSTFAGNFDRAEATIAGNNANLIIIGSSTANDANGAGVTFRDPKFLSALNTLTVKEGIFRIEKEAGSNASFSGLSPTNITNGITIGYGGASIGDQSNGSLMLGANVGARLNFYRNLDTVHSVKITMDGVQAQANSGYNYIDLGADATAPNPRTYLSGEITLLGDADRNIFHIDAVGATALSIGEQGNQTAAIQSKLIIKSAMGGTGGFTKTGARELRLTGTNTFTGNVNILRFGAAAMDWQDNVVNFNGVNYQTYGNGEGWAEAGVVLAGVSGTLSGTSNINLQRRGLLTLDNTTRLDITSQTSGGNNNDRINNAANILFNHGWLRIIGGTVDNNEALATASGAKVQVLSGSNMLDLLPTDGANVAMNLTIGEISRAPGSVLYINNLDSTSKFTTTSGPESVRVLLNNIGTLQMTGANNTATSKPVITGLFGGIMPHQYLSDMRVLGYNNSGNSDYLSQGRNQQFITATHFMTWDSTTKALRPLDDSEYFIPVDGLIDTQNGSAGQNVSLNNPFTIVRENTSINALRFGPVADNNGSGGAINNTTTLTGLIDAHNVQLYVDGTLNIASGMISSGYFTLGNSGSASTFIMGGTLDFGTREAIINNQNAYINSTAGTVSTGNLEIRSNIAGSGGLTKTGLAQVVLDGRNTYSGVTTVSNGNLFLRNGRQALGAGGAGNGVVVEGNGNLFSGNGIQIGTATAREDILVKALQGNQSIFRVDNDLTNYFGNLVIDNVDAAGQALFTPIIRLDNAASAIMNGNITGGSTAISNDIIAIDSRLVEFQGNGNNAYIFRGQFGDKLDANGNAVPIANPITTQTTSSTRTNENEVLRVNFNGATDTNFILDKQYNAAGRLTAVQGNIIINYDPMDPARDGNGFWTDTALSKIPGADSTSTALTLNGGTSHQGFVLGTTANSTSSLFLTKPGQLFNMAAWTANGSGVKHLGGLNESGTVTFGSSTATGALTVAGTALRLYANAGGTVVLDHRITGSPGTAPNNIGITKVGRGTVILENSTNTTASDSNFEIGGGKLILDFDGQNVARVGAGNAIFNGGVVHARSNPNANSIASYAATSAANNILQIRQGTTEVVSEGVGGRFMWVNMGNANANNNTANITRVAGSAMNLVELVSGASQSYLSMSMNNFTNAVVRNRAVSWATYSNTPREALDFAMVSGYGPTVVTFTGTTTNGNANLTSVADTSKLMVGMAIFGPGVGVGAVITSISGTTVVVSVNSTVSATVSLTASVPNDVTSYTRVAGEYLNNVASWANGMDVSENGGAGFTGTLAGSRALNTLRFDTMADSVVNLGANTLSLIGDGIAGGILVSSNTGTANKTINGGTLAGFSKTFTGTTTNGNANITNVSNIADLTVGMPITGTGIPTGAYITGISGTTVTISANATASGTPTNLNVATADIVVHQYGKGSLTLNSLISNPNSTTNGILTIAGPSATTVETYGTTGKVRLTNIANDYRGATHINGAVLEISQGGVLGFDPAAYTTSQVVMNGGALRWTGDAGTLGNRGITFNGNGGLIDVASASGNLVIGNIYNGTGSTAPINSISTLASQELFRGDLVKMGAGTLTLLGNSASFSGLIDIRQGTLITMVDIAGNNSVGTTTVLGSSRSWADGTIFRQGTNFQAFLGNGNHTTTTTTSEWNIDEFMTFEGNNTFTYGGLLDVNADINGSLDGQYNLSNRRPLNLNGNLDIKGTTTFDVTFAGVLRLNNGSGYLTGSGDIVKDGPGQLHFRANVPDWKGNLVIKQGSVYAANQADVLGTGYVSDKTITLGDAERAGVAELLVQNADGVHAWAFDINHDINVVYNPSQTKRLGIDNITNSNLVAYNGDITLNDSLILLARDVSTAVGGEQAMVNFNGSFRDGTVTSGNLVVQVDDLDTTVNNQTSNRTYGYVNLNADNSAWTGDITIGTNTTAYNQDATAILRLGNAKALTAANDVVMNYNTILQVGGQNVTIGNLTTQGGVGAFYGDAGTMSAQTNGSSEVIENASSTPAVLTIATTTPASFESLWDAHFRDGTLNSQFFAPGTNTLQPSASLSITKAGSGWATLTLDNNYNGATVIQAGILQVGRGGIGDTGSINATGTTVMPGATIAGSGTVQGGLTLMQGTVVAGQMQTNGGVLKVGDSAGAAIGTLTVSGSAIFSAGSSALMQIRNASYNNPSALTASDPQYQYWRDGVLTDSFSNGLNDLVTTAQHDMLNVVGTINWAPGSKITLSNDGYTPKAGDIIRLFRANSYTGTLNVGQELRYGGEIDPTLDLLLFNLGGNLMWDVTQFLTKGVLMVVEANAAVDVVNPPSILSGPDSNQSQTEKLAPGTEMLLTAEAQTEGDVSKLKFAWLLNGVPIPTPDPSPAVYEKMYTETVAGQPKRLKAFYKFKANFNTKGVYHVVATNEGGSRVSANSVTVLVDDVPEIGVPPSAATVNPGATHTFQVTASGLPNFTYQWYKDGAPIGTPVTTAQVTNTFVINNVSEANEGYYHVRVTNDYGFAESSPVLLKVRNPITNVVATVSPATAYVDQALNFSVTFEGDDVQTIVWKKGSTQVGTGAAFSIAKALTTDSGDYTATITSPVGSVVSNTVTVLVRTALPTIPAGGAPASLTLFTGEPLPLALTYYARPAVNFVWKKNNAVVPSGVFADISKASATLADGGTYTVEVTNDAGKANTTLTPTEIVVVDAPQNVVYLPLPVAAAATFTARVAAGPKTVVSYQWVRVRTTTAGEDGQFGTADDVQVPEYEEVLVDGGRFSGVKTKTMKLTAVTLADAGIYRVRVKGPDLGAGDDPVTGSSTDLRVYDKAPQFDLTSPVISVGKIVFTQGLIGADYSFQVPVDRNDPTQSPDKITATGLPAGLKIDPISGLITGKPTAVTKPEGSLVTITLANKIKTAQPIKLTGNLIVRDLASTIVGAWTGVVERSSVQPLGGRVDITVAVKGTYTGKLILGGATYSFTGALDLSTSTPTGTAFIKRAGKPALSAVVLNFALNPTNNTFSAGTINDGSNTANFSGWRQVYKAKTAEATKYLGYHTLSIALPDDSPLIPANDINGSTTVPLGAGYASFTVAVDGKMTLVGKMPDGEAVSVASFIGPNGEIAVYQHMYKAITSTAGPLAGLAGGSLVGLFDIDDRAAAPDEATQGTSNNTLSGDATWVRPASSKATDRIFKAGFGLTEPLEVVAIGGRYDAPAVGKSVLDLPEVIATTAPNNAYVDFLFGQDLGWTYHVTGVPTPLISQNPDQDLLVTKGSKVTASKVVSVNPTKTTLTAVPKTGMFTGSFATDDISPRYPIESKNIKRAVKFQGVIIKENGQLIGVGYFVMPTLSSPSQNTLTSKDTPNVSGRVIFDKLP